MEQDAESNDEYTEVFLDGTNQRPEAEENALLVFLTGGHLHIARVNAGLDRQIDQPADRSAPSLSGTARDSKGQSGTAMDSQGHPYCSCCCCFSQRHIKSCPRINMSISQLVVRYLLKHHCQYFSVVLTHYF